METWEAYFTELLQQTALKQHDDPEEPPKTETMPTITEAEVWSVVQRSKTRKATGPDNISNELIKASLPHTISIWTALYNKCVQLQNIPNVWKKSTMKMIIQRPRTTGCTRLI